MFYYTLNAKNGVRFLLLCWQQATQCANVTWLPLEIMHRGHTHAYNWLWVSLMWLSYYLELYDITGTNIKNSLHAFGQSEEIASDMYNNTVNIMGDNYSLVLTRNQVKNPRFWVEFLTYKLYNNKIVYTPEIKKLFHFILSKFC